MERIKACYPACLMAAVLVFCGPMLFTAGLPLGNDLSFHLSRVTALKEALDAGVFLPGVYSDYFSGLGYGSGLFYPDIFLYMPVLLMYLGFSTIAAYKIYLIILTAAMAWAMYFSVRWLGFSKNAALFSALIYLFASFHTTDVYVRSSLGEIQAFVFLPLTAAGFADVLWGQGRRPGPLILGASGLILSHVLTAAVTALLLGILALAFIKGWLSEPWRLKTLGVAALFIFLMTAFFTLPMLEQMALNPIWGDQGLNGAISDWAVPLNQLILAVPRLLGASGVLPAGIGLGLFFCGVLGLLQKNRRLRLCTGLGMALLFMSSELFPWEVLGDWLQTLQFPWRLYIFVTLCFALAAGPALEGMFDKRKTRWILGGALMAAMLLSFSVQSAFVYANYQGVTENPYPTFPAGCEYLPENMDYSALVSKAATAGEGLQRQDYNTYHFTLTTPRQELPLVYYPGYRAEMAVTQEDGSVRYQAAALKASETGFTLVDSEGTGEIVVTYCGTALARGSRYLSLGGILLFFIYLHRRKRTCDT
ncbi:MAG: hypothetical protein Q4C55_05340 [Eubacterium sp.]|nr:hypothetical protein [Eubacterium sp.]